MVTRTANPDTFPTEPMAVENSDMMAGSDIYRRVQTKKKSAMTYVVPAVVVIALGAGAAMYAMQPANHQTPTAPAAVASQQQANNAAQQANISASAADSSAKTAIAANDQAQANAVAATGNPPSATTDTDRVRTSAPVRHAKRTAVRVRPAAAPYAGSSASDVDAVTPPPAAVAATPVTPTPSLAQPVQPAPAIPPAPATTSQPQTVTPDSTPAQQ